MSENDPLPDDLRCKRTDGRQWRCKRRVLEGKKLCDLHHMQGRHRQMKQKVPDSLKFERARNIKIKNSGEIGVSKKKLKASKRKRCVSEALDEALKRMELKRGDLPLELIRVFLKRQVEKRKQKELKNSVELTRELPNAVMAIPNLPSHDPSNSTCSSSNIKLGVNLSPFSARHFRSKNIEPLPISTMQALPLSKNMRKVKRKKCHWCRRTNYRTLIKCSSCKKQFFCTDCIKERHLERLEIQGSCPVCRGCCNCRICTKSKPKDTNYIKEFYRDKKKVRKSRLLYYLVNALLPVLEKIIQDQYIELEVEANTTGKPYSIVQIQHATMGFENSYCCSNCKTSILDFHRSCSSCSFLLCINCCSDLRQRYKSFSGVDDGDVSISCPSTESGGCSGGILQLRSLFPCNWLKEIEASAREALCSSRRFDETKEVDNNDTAVNNLLMEMAQRLDSNDNFLYCPILKDLQFENFNKYWGKGHPVIVRSVLRSSSDLSWDPVFMFCTYLEKRSKFPKEKEAKRTPDSLDWCEVEIATKKTFMGSLQWQTQATIRKQTVKLRAWLSPYLFEEQFPLYYVEIMRALPFQEYMNPKSGALNLALNVPRETQPLDLGPSIYISYGGSEELVRTEFATNLCFEPYDVVNILAYAADAPISKEQLCKVKTLMKKKIHMKDQTETTSTSTEHRGKSSLQSEDTDESGLQDVNAEQGQLPDAIAKVPFYSADSHTKAQTVLEESNMLTDSECDAGSDSDISILCSESIDRLTDSENDDPFHESCMEKVTAISGAQWDIFRRQDVPKLLEYLGKHSKEFTSSCCYSKKVLHPILDQCFFLDAYHKLKLKEEFDVQPWTFEQHPGEAVTVPAGCPYQVRQLKSCVNIVLNFLSPESAAECIRLTDEIRLLPGHHKAKKKLMEVKKMAICSIQDAVDKIQDITNTRT
ncbi:unnamed protein product [Cuscuta epithymum]|uniref:Lysine-specific demethylase JMJ25 n=2 Tax=Cuscuta epithymum TaxID=186058 RepID=A0AAV0G1N5_9ASTE|nr:unnamed protein product [Cuscuta epithymum]